VSHPSNSALSVRALPLPFPLSPRHTGFVSRPPFRTFLLLTSSGRGHSTRGPSRVRACFPSLEQLGDELSSLPLFFSWRVVSTFSENSSYCAFFLDANHHPRLDLVSRPCSLRPFSRSRTNFLPYQHPRTRSTPPSQSHDLRNSPFRAFQSSKHDLLSPLPTASQRAQPPPPRPPPFPWIQLSPPLPVNSPCPLSHQAPIAPAVQSVRPLPSPPPLFSSPLPSPRHAPVHFYTLMPPTLLAPLASAVFPAGCRHAEPRPDSATF